MTSRASRSVRLPLLAVGCLLLAACGQRLDGATRQQLLDQSVRGSTQGSAVAPGGTTGSGAPGGATSGGATSGTSGTGTTGVGSGTTGTSGSGTSGTATSGTTGTGTAPAGGNGGATDVGVTATSISIATVADISGPQPGLFKGDLAGVKAYLAYTNSTGGVFGRTITQATSDSGLDCNQTSQAYASFAPKVFAFVGSLMLFDNCAAQTLKKFPKVPDVSYVLTPEHQANPTTYSGQPSVPGQRTGPGLAFAKAFPEVKAAVGGLYPNVAGATSQWKQFRETFEHLGFTVVYDQAIPPTTVDYTQYVIGMRQAGVKMVVLLNTAANNAKFVNAAQQQGFAPPVIESPGTMYDPSFADAVGPDVPDVFVDTTTALYASPDEAKTVPGVALYQKWMKQVAPDQDLDQFSTFGWLQGALFVQALKAVGPRLTQAGLLAALKNIHSVDTGGMVSSGDPGRKLPAHCFLLAHYDKGVWKRFNSPSTGFDCSKPYYFTGS